MEETSEDIKNIGKRLVSAFKTKEKLYKELTKYKSDLEVKLKEQEILKRAVVLFAIEEEQEVLNEANPAVFGTGYNRITVLSFGSLPTADIDKFYTTDAIFPIGFVSRRKYKKHKLYEKNTIKEKIIYVCSITLKGPKIVAEDDKQWEGETVWEDFTNCFDEINEYKTLQDFFGITVPTVAKKIEELGDISVFKNYIPVDNRTTVFKQKNDVDEKSGYDSDLE